MRVWLLASALAIASHPALAQGSEPGRDVQRIADAGGVVVADHDLAGVDGDPQADPARELGVLAQELTEGPLHLDGRAHGAQGVVLGHARHASQKRRTGSHSAPQAGQRGTRLAPQPPQNRAPAFVARPQLEQTMADLPPPPYYCRCSAGCDCPSRTVQIPYYDDLKR